VLHQRRSLGDADEGNPEGVEDSLVSLERHSELPLNLSSLDFERKRFRTRILNVVWRQGRSLCCRL
jgi:hypothetical protein